MPQYSVRSVFGGLKVILKDMVFKSISSLQCFEMFSNILDRKEYIRIHEGRCSCFSFANILQAISLFSAKLNVLLFGYLCFVLPCTMVPSYQKWRRVWPLVRSILMDYYTDGWNAGLPMSYLDDFDKPINDQNSV